MYASQKITVREIKVPSRESISDNFSESQRTIDSYLPSRVEIVDGPNEMKRVPNPPKQQISIDSFLTKKPSPTKPANEVHGQESVRPSNFLFQQSSRPLLSVEMSSTRSNAWQLNSPYPTDGDTNTSANESTIRFESKSSPLPLSRDPSPAAPGELSPNTKAKIEANRLKALARRNEILMGKKTSIPHSSSPSLQISNQNQVIQTFAPPVITTQEFDGRKPYSGLTDLGHVNTSPEVASLPRSTAPGHVFSTGTGNALRVSQDAIDRANLIFTNPTPTNPGKKVRSID
jgi:hypothetical protein